MIVQRVLLIAVYITFVYLEILGHGYTFTENEVDERGKMKIQYEIEQGLRDTGDKDDEAVFEEEEGKESRSALHF